MTDRDPLQSPCGVMTFLKLINFLLGSLIVSTSDIGMSYVSLT